jgi:homocysteine S-methyltransferase
LQEKLNAGQFVVSVEVDPPRGMNYEKIIAGVIQCKQNRVDAVNIADNPLAKAGMTPLAMANLIKETVQIETMLHVSCRDRNILALQSELMSAFIMGIRNVLCITGDPPVVGDYPGATGVFDVDSIGLIKMISNLNQGTDLAGKSIGSKTELFIACAVNPTAVDLIKEYDRFEQKMDTGADLAMTQIMYDLKALDQFAKRFKGRIPILLGIMPLKNAKHANFMHNEIPDITIPEPIRERMAGAGENGPQTGVEIAKNFLKEAKSMVDGIYIIPPFNNYSMAIAVMDAL